jgi:hypothetical protein
VARLCRKTSRDHGWQWRGSERPRQDDGKQQCGSTRAELEMSRERPGKHTAHGRHFICPERKVEGHQEGDEEHQT